MKEEDLIERIGSALLHKTHLPMPTALEFEPAPDGHVVIADAPPWLQALVCLEAEIHERGLEYAKKKQKEPLFEALRQKEMVRNVIDGILEQSSPFSGFIGITILPDWKVVGIPYVESPSDSHKPH